ncbi:hypothetical protein Y032_0283g1319 [Ancylostoma ceylanicum]|uniref:Uncharacterized protein n=1 Tax=Ancylostoma ceylanicum TaxID=53326 RepID=A0A016S6W7_9BILA|nr:hypothetical protein Y032_0283g1319 [Ancylostoma ceylanicum]
MVLNYFVSIRCCYEERYNNACHELGLAYPPLIRACDAENEDAGGYEEFTDEQVNDPADVAMEICVLLRTDIRGYKAVDDKFLPPAKRRALHPVNRD